MKFLTNQTIKILGLFGLSLFAQQISADPVDVATAKKVAQTQLKQITHGTISTRSSEKMELVYQAKSKDTPSYFYVFNSDNSFVIVSGDDKAIPILGYSDQGAFDPNNIPPNMAEFLKGYEKEIEYAIQNISTRSGELKQKWDNLINGQINYNYQGITQTTLNSINTRSYVVGNNLIETTWNQDGIYEWYQENGVSKYKQKRPLYNYYCPNHDDPHNFTYTGCVATAMAQAVAYWGKKGSLPSKGYGNNSYTSFTHPEYGVLSADFSSTTYNYSNMPSKLISTTPIDQIKDVALLIYHCGISVSMNYGTIVDGGSGASTAEIATSLLHFGIPNAIYKNKSNYSNDVWSALLKDEIDNERPMVYRGSGSGGHAFICDGYKNDNTFHFNWGWGGSYDGFFVLSSLTPGGNDFSNGQGAIFNIQPETIILPTAINLTPTDTTIKVNGGGYLKTTIEPANTTKTTIKYKSSNESIVFVYNNGYMLAKAPGTATITATTALGGVATCTVTVPIPVNSISVTPSTTSITVGQTTTLSADILPSDAADKTVTWFSSNNTRATVNANGIVTGLTAGTVTITARSNYDNSKTATATVTILPAPILVSNITLNKTSITLKKDETTTLTANITPSNTTDKTVTWSSGNTSVATVDANGVITALTAGTTTITATANDGSGKTSSCTITVIIPVTGVSLNKNTTSIAAGSTETLTATIIPNNATTQNVTWTSNNPSVATVSNGVITAVSSGTVTITVTTQDGSHTATCNVTVTQPVTGVSLNKTNTTIIAGNTEALTPTFSPSNATNKNVAWTSSDNSVATVSGGVITAVSGGAAIITATTQDGSHTATCNVTVTQPVTGISLNMTNITIAVGNSPTSLTATILPANATNINVSWSSGNTNVATVTNGIITAVAAGTTTITAITQDGNKTATCNVTVTQPATGVSLNKINTSLIVGGTETLTASVLPSHATNKTVTWSSDNTGVATVTNGIITAISTGNATITVTTQDGSYTATCMAAVSPAPISVSGVSMPSTITLYTGETNTLTATVAPSNATNQNVSWSSSNPSIASVSNGTVSAISAGTVTITATTDDGGYTATCTVTINQYVTNISLNKANATILNGNTETLTTTIAPTNATNQNTNWSSDNTSVATVTNGVVSTIGKGSANITATAADGSGITATCAITVTQPVTSITLSPASPVSLKVGETETLVTTVAPASADNQNLTWSSDNTTVATVSNGVITAVGKGSANITATAVDGSGTFATCAVTVTQSVTSILLNKTSTSILNGNTETLTTTVLPANANNQSIVWSSDNTTVATVSATGIISTVTTGTANITATATDGSGVIATCAVTVTQPVTGITLNPASPVSLNVGETEALIATIIPSSADNQNILWTSDNTTVATVSNGVITAIGKGSANIIATAADGSGATSNCSVTVTQPVTGVSLDKTSVVIPTGSSEQLTATIQPANANNQNATWSSDNSGIASVDNNGNITAHAAGTATISATTADGSFVASCIVTVTIPVTNVSLSQTALSLFVGSDAVLMPNVLPANASNQNVTWSSDNTAIAIVDANGKVSGIAQGTANVTVTTVDGNYTETCLVEVMTIAPSIVNVTGVSLNKSTTSIDEGDWEVLTATLTPANATDQGVTWTSSNPTIATITSSGSGTGYQLGKISAISTGTTIITVSTDDGGYTATCTVTVTANPTTINVSNVSIDNPGSSSITQSGTLQLSATVTPTNATNKNVIWTSNNTAVATVNSNGVVTAVSAGTVIITVTTQDGSFTDTFTITVTSTTGIENAQTTSVWSHNGNIYIKTPVATDIYIFNLAGELVYTSNITEGQHAIPMNRGTYIVTTNNDFQEKVYVK